jgi:hypothetical protein
MTVDVSECYITAHGHPLSHALVTESRRFGIFLITAEPQSSTIILWRYRSQDWQYVKLLCLEQSSNCGKYLNVQGIIYGAFERFLMTAVRDSKSALVLN